MLNCYKITFELHNDLEIQEETVDLLWDYLGCLYKNGQIINDYQLLKNGQLFFALVTPQDDHALQEKNNNIYVQKYLDEIKIIFKVNTELVGENMNVTNACTCADPSWFILYTDYCTESSPIVCGDCGNEYPLYKLPHIDKSDEHHGIVGWQKTYKSIDGLFMYCLSDRFTYRQLHSPLSQLFKIGMEICTDLESATKKPFYYYQYNYQKTSKTCPICKEDWKLPQNSTFVDYKCEKCRVVADEV